MTFSNPIAANGGEMTYPALFSQGYTPGISGWILRRDGTVEFNALGGTFQVNTLGVFFYIPTAGTGNLVASFTDVSGTDPYGNSYIGGFFLNQHQAHFTGDNSHTVKINPDGSSGPRVTWTPSGFNAMFQILGDIANNRVLMQQDAIAGIELELNMPVSATGGYLGDCSFQGAEVSYPASSSAFTDYSTPQWRPPSIVCPPSETVDLIIWMMAHPSTVTANQTITIAPRIKVGSTVLFAPSGVLSGCEYQSNGAAATTNDVFTAVHHTIGTDILSGRAGQTLTFVPSVRITSTGSPNPHIAQACMSVKPSLYAQVTSTIQ